MFSRILGTYFLNFVLSKQLNDFDKIISINTTIKLVVQSH